MRKDGARPIDLAELAFERREPEAHLGRLLVGEALDRALVDGARGGETKVGSGFGDVVGEHLRAVRLGRDLGGRGEERTSIRSVFSTACVARS